MTENKPAHTEADEEVLRRAIHEGQEGRCVHPGVADAFCELWASELMPAVEFIVAARLAARADSGTEFVDALVFHLVDGNCDLADRDPVQHVWDDARRDVELLVPFINEHIARRLAALWDQIDGLIDEHGIEVNESGQWDEADASRAVFVADLERLRAAAVAQKDGD